MSQQQLRETHVRAAPLSHTRRTSLHGNHSSSRCSRGATGRPSSFWRVVTHCSGRRSFAATAQSERAPRIAPRALSQTRASGSHIGSDSCQNPTMRAWVPEARQTDFSSLAHSRPCDVRAPSWWAPDRQTDRNAWPKPGTTTNRHTQRQANKVKFTRARPVRGQHYSL